MSTVKAIHDWNNNFQGPSIAYALRFVSSCENSISVIHIILGFFFLTRATTLSLNNVIKRKWASQDVNGSYSYLFMLQDSIPSDNIGQMPQVLSELDLPRNADPTACSVDHVLQLLQRVYAISREQPLLCRRIGKFWYLSFIIHVQEWLKIKIKKQNQINVMLALHKVHLAFRSQGHHFYRSYQPSVGAVVQLKMQSITFTHIEFNFRTK